MQKIDTTVVFTCPECKEKFEFDDVGKNQLVPCPLCKNHCVTIQRGNALLLECFNLSSPNTKTSE